MAEKKSTLITNADVGGSALQRTYNTARMSFTPSKWERDYNSVAAADSDGDIYRHCRIPSWANIRGLWVANTAITAGTDYDLGGYYTARDGGAVILKDGLLDGIDMSSARAQPTNLTYQKQTDLTKVNQLLWQWLGLSADPNKLIDLCWTANTVGSAAGTIFLGVEWGHD